MKSKPINSPLGVIGHYTYFDSWDDLEKYTEELLK